MRFAAIAALGVLLAGCGPKSAETEPPAELPAPLDIAALPPAVATPAPVPKRLAAEGTYFLLVKKSVETADGIIGFKPGTKVAKQADGSFAVEGHKLRLLPNEITNDLDLAARFADADAQRQAALRPMPTPPPPAATPSPDAAPALRPGSANGASRTLTKDGWVWEKGASGQWKRARPVR